VRVIHEDRRGQVWVGTYGGLSLWQNGRFTNYSLAPERNRGLVRSIHDDRSGTLWVGTAGNGLYRFRNGRLLNYTTRDGLPSDVIYQILEDKRGSLWMSCNRGLFRVALSDLEAFVAGRGARLASTSFGVEDGMASHECNGGGPAGAQTPDGRLWFPTVKGLASIDPERLDRNTTPPPVVIESVVSNGRVLEADQGLSLPPGQERLELRYAALSLLAPRKVRFSYRLEGLDRLWTDASSERRASYTHVPPGKYTFRVRAVNADGVWNETGATLRFTVRPRLTESRWFSASVALALLALLGAFVQIRLRRSRRHEEELQRRVREALDEVKVLKGLLPICAGCRKIRDDSGYWSELEVYVGKHANVRFSHGLCPHCLQRLYPEFAEQPPSEPPHDASEGETGP
jgi:hypothetical protein